MSKVYVYRVKSQNRLLIVKQQIIDSDYEELMNTNGPDHDMLMNSCKLFCLGYIAGAQNGEPVLNKMQEFQ